MQAQSTLITFNAVWQHMAYLRVCQIFPRYLYVPNIYLYIIFLARHAHIAHSPASTHFSIIFRAESCLSPRSYVEFYYPRKDARQRRAIMMPPHFIYFNLRLFPTEKGNK